MLTQTLLPSSVGLNPSCGRVALIPAHRQCSEVKQDIKGGYNAHMNAQLKASISGD